MSPMPQDPHPILGESDDDFRRRERRGNLVEILFFGPWLVMLTGLLVATLGILAWRALP